MCLPQISISFHCVPAAETWARASCESARIGHTRCVLDPVDATNNLAQGQESVWDHLLAMAEKLEAHIKGDPEAYRKLNGGLTGIACIDAGALPVGADRDEANKSRNEALEINELCQKNMLSLDVSFRHSDASCIPPR